MRIPSDYKQIISKFVREKWILLAKRTEVPILPLLEKLEILNSLKCEKLYGTKLPTITTWNYPYFKFYLYGPKYRKIIESMTELFFSSKINAHFKKIIHSCNLEKQMAVSIQKHDLTMVSSAELLKLHSSVTKYYSDAFLYGFVTWAMQVLQEQALSIIDKFSKKLDNLGINKNIALERLIIPSKQTVYNKKEETLNLLSVKYKATVKKIKKTSPEEIAKTLPKLHRAINDFLNEYRWVGYDYNGPKMSYGEVILAILERKKTTKDSITKKRISNLLKLGSSEQRIFDLISSLAYIKDLRNSTDDFLHFCLDSLYTEVGRRYGLTKLEVRYLWPEEFRKLLNGEETFSKKYIQEKISCCLVNTFVHDPSKKYLVGDKAEKIISEKLKLQSTSLDKSLCKFRGMSVSPGSIIAKVKIVRTFNDVDKLKKGEILVTHMTSPRYMAAIMRSSAIITDDGGITCHAAIMAREMKKPCIVGTKIATKVLKDGDIVEVDADNGIVKILK